MHNCRFCSTPLELTFCDLGQTPPSNSYLKTLSQKEPYFPLHAFVCSNCYLVQLGQFQTPAEIFSDYAYFSSYSDSWLEHAKQYVNKVTQRFHLNSESFVVEIASNDGYLLQYFKEKNIPILGVEPAINVAATAQAKGIPTLTKFFGLKTAEEIVPKASLIIGNNVLAHVPDINDFVSGISKLLASNGIVTIEFPHLLQLIKQNQFDTIYHEHFSYLSLISSEKIFNRWGLELFDVEELSTHGGSLRVYLQHQGDKHAVTSNIQKVKNDEIEFGLTSLPTYLTYSAKVQEYKKNLRSFFQQIKAEKKLVAGYGAPAKGNTLLNYCQLTPEELPFTVDRSPHKQGHFLPGSHIPIYDPSMIEERKPDYLFILPWNLKEEIIQQMAYIKKWGGKFVIPIPEVIVISA